MSRLPWSVCTLVLAASPAVAADEAVPVTALMPGVALKAGAKKTAPAGGHELVMQGDGNLVWYSGGKAVWSTGTSGVRDAECVLQGDGNLVVYGTRDGKRGPVWASDTSGQKDAVLACQADGNLVLYAKLADGYKPIWDANGSVAAAQKERLSTGESVGVQLIGGPIVGTAINVNSKMKEVRNEAFRARIEIVPEKAARKEAEVAFDDAVIDKPVFTEPYETLPGVSRTFQVDRSYETAITVTGTVGVEVGAQATAGTPGVASVSADIKTKVEASLGITVAKKTTVTESFTLDGKSATAVNVKWVERYRKGTATLPDGQKYEILVLVGLRMKLEPVK